jgi:hypothetical protein
LARSRHLNAKPFGGSNLNYERYTEIDTRLSHSCGLALAKAIALTLLEK